MLLFNPDFTGCCLLYNRGSKNARIAEIINVLGLQRCSNTVIRNQGPSISGGERKRVAIGEELITAPSLILLDEPTSGLDSASARILVSFFLDLVKGGRTIICTIHQPSTAVYMKFNKLLVLTMGEQMYFGSIKCCLALFDALGSTCPRGMSAAEFIIDIATVSKVRIQRFGIEL